MRSLELLSGVVLALLTVTVLCAAEHRGVVRFAGLPVPRAAVTASQGNTKLVDDRADHRLPYGRQEVRAPRQEDFRDGGEERIAL
jgi:hypothetical protein